MVALRLPFLYMIVFTYEYGTYLTPILCRKFEQKTERTSSSSNDT